MPETTDYMIAGYAVVVLIVIASAIYLVLKARNLRSELHMLEQLDAEDRAASPQPAREPMVSREPRSGDVAL